MKIILCTLLVMFICILPACNYQNSYIVPESDSDSSTLKNENTIQDEESSNLTFLENESEKTINDVTFNYLNSEKVLTDNEEKAIFELVLNTFNYLGGDNVDKDLMETYWKTEFCESYFIFSMNNGIDDERRNNQFFHDFKVPEGRLDDHFDYFICKKSFWRNAEIRIYNLQVENYNTELLLDIENSFNHFRTDLISLCNLLSDDAQDYNNYSVTLYILPDNNYAVSFCDARIYNKESRSILGSWLFFSLNNKTEWEVKGTITFYDNVQG